MTEAHFKTVIAALCMFFGVVWSVRTWLKVRTHQQAMKDPVGGYWGRVAARELAKRARAELCGGVLVFVTGVLLLVHSLR